MFNFLSSFVYRGTKPNRKVWITLRELSKYFNLVSTLSALDHKSVKLFGSRVEHLIRKSGFQFAFPYLKEANRLTLKALSGEPEIVGVNSRIYVKRDRSGIPTILPGTFRHILRMVISDPLLKERSDMLPQISQILTLLTVYRVFSIKTPVSLDTVVSEFTGTSRTFSPEKVRKALEDLLGKQYKIRGMHMRLIGGESSGPNGWKAIFCTGVDGFAFFFYYKQLLNFIRVSSFMKNGGLFSLWLIALMVLNLPIWLLSRGVGFLELLAHYILYHCLIWKIRIEVDNSMRASFAWGSIGLLFFYTFYWSSVQRRLTEVDNSVWRKIRNKALWHNFIPKMGKLGVVHDTAGKARVVGITNWWIQLCLKPLHTALFHKLRTIECDGTFDQDGALDRLLSRVPRGTKFYSFDLSAATDRLPVDLQETVLSEIVSQKFGSYWRGLLDFGWFYKSSVYRYAVGQPMGAYSSWAMLALTHHVIVKMAALQVGYVSFKDYAVLGDDVVIANDKVASEYSFIMKTLGVSLNPSKSIESYDFCEFAKRLRGHGINFTPVGPGLVLRTLRDTFYIARLLLEVHNLHWLRSSSDLLAVLGSLGINFETTKCILWMFFGVSKGVLGKPFDIDHPFSGRIISFSSGIPRYTPHSKFEPFGRIDWSALSTVVCDHLLLMYDQRIKQFLSDKLYFYRNWWRIIPLKDWPMRLLESLRILTPGFWYFALMFETTPEEIRRPYTVLAQSARTDPDYVRQLVELDPNLDIMSIDWLSRKQVRDSYRELIKLHMHYAEQADTLGVLYVAHNKKLDMGYNGINILDYVEDDW